MSDLRSIIYDAGVPVEGHFIFADGDHALIKLEMDTLWHHPKELGIVLDALAVAERLPQPDVILGVPTGGQKLADELVKSGRLSIPIAYLERVPGGTKQDFRFVSKQDEELASAATHIRIYEDVVTTLSSIAGVVKLLNPEQQEIHSLAIWRRGVVKEVYRVGVQDHYLVEEVMPSFAPGICPYPGCKKR